MAYFLHVAVFVFRCVSLIYLVVWYWDPTMLTLFAFTGLFISLADYLGPKIVAKVCCLLFRSFLEQSFINIALHGLFWGSVFLFLCALINLNL